MIKTLISKNTLALVAGVFLTFAYSPFQIWPLSILCMTVLFYLINQVNTVKESAKIGFCFGFGWFAAGISWVHVSIAEFGGLPLAVSVLLMAFLCAYLALFPMLTMILFKRTQKHFSSSITQLTLLLLLWLITEWLRATLFTGFPWLSLGYTLTDSPVAKLAYLTGEPGLGLLIIAIAFLAAHWLKHKASKEIYGAAGIALTAWLISVYYVPIKYTEDSIKVASVQGNIQQSLRWNPDQAWPTLAKYLDMTRRNWGADIIFWPEAAVPEIEAFASDHLRNLDKAATNNNAAVITGILDVQLDTKIAYNNLIVLGKKEQDSTEGHYNYLHTNRYSKHQLLPIGEFVPFEEWLRPIAPLFNLAHSSFTRGERKQPNLRANGLNILPAICYEIVFSDLLLENFSDSSDILFTVSNDAWFGDSHGPHQHMQIARMRALEFGRPLIRVTNNGITANFDPLALKEQRVPQFEDQVLTSEINKITGKTLYSQWGKTPLFMLILSLSILTTVTELILRKRQ